MLCSKGMHSCWLSALITALCDCQTESPASQDQAELSFATAGVPSSSSPALARPSSNSPALARPISNNPALSSKSQAGPSEAAPVTAAGILSSVGRKPQAGLDSLGMRSETRQRTATADQVGDQQGSMSLHSDYRVVTVMRVMSVVLCDNVASCEALWSCVRRLSRC